MKITVTKKVQIAISTEILIFIRSGVVYINKEISIDAVFGIYCIFPNENKRYVAKPAKSTLVEIR
jgi:hypothetical protein